MRAVRTLLVLAVAANGAAAGAALDQTIKQLPARHDIGLSAYSAYSQAADLSQGVLWYGALGVGTALLTLVTAGVGLRASRLPAVRWALGTAVLATLGFLTVTAFAAPLYHTQRDAADEAALAEIFETFVWLNAVRTGLIVVAAVAVVAALLTILRPARQGSR